MERKIISVASAVATNGKIEVQLDGNIAPFPIDIFWEGIRYNIDNINGVAGVRSGNLLYLPLLMAGDAIDVIYWTLSDGDTIAGGSNAVVSSCGLLSSACDNVRFIVNNAVPVSLLNCNAVLPPEMPVGNIKTEWRSRIMRHTKINDPVIISGEVTDYRSFSGMALVGHNISPAGTVKLRLYEKNDNELTLRYDSGEKTLGLLQPMGEFIWGVDPWGAAKSSNINPAFDLWFEEVSANYFEVELFDPYNPAGCIDLRQLIIGDALKLDNNFSYGMTMSWESGQSFRRTEGGSLLTIGNHQVWRKISLPLEFLTDFDRQRIAKLQRNSSGAALFISVFPSAGESDREEFSMAAKFNLPNFTHLELDKWTASLELLEV